MVDWSASDLLTTIFFMKKDYGFTLTEIESLYEFEFEIYYYMCLKDFKIKEEERAKLNKKNKR